MSAFQPKAIKKLNLGCGPDYKKGWVNLDYHRAYNPDVFHNMDKIPYPFKKEEFHYVYCSHILEHVEDFFNTMKEIERIIKKNGILHIRVPHFSNGNGYNDLTHRRFFGWFTFNQFINGYYNQKTQFRIISKRFNFLAVEHKFVNRIFSWFFNTIPKQFYERFLCWIVPVGEIEIRLRKIKN